MFLLFKMNFNMLEGRKVKAHILELKMKKEGKRKDRREIVRLFRFFYYVDIFTFTLKHILFAYKLFQQFWIARKLFHIVF